MPSAPVLPASAWSGKKMCNDNALPAHSLRGPASILIVEDSFDLRFTLAEWLRHQKYIVLEAATADEAKTLLASPFSIDLVITDIEMPGSMNGLDLVAHIKKTNALQNIIVVSGGDKDAGLKEQGVAFFKKPYDLRAISSCIEKFLKDRL
jgi:DNA-binding NtrC family response regulator